MVLKHSKIPFEFSWQSLGKVETIKVDVSHYSLRLAEEHQDKESVILTRPALPCVAEKAAEVPATKWSQRCVLDLMSEQEKQDDQDAPQDKVDMEWLEENKMTIADVKHLIK